MTRNRSIWRTHGVRVIGMSEDLAEDAAAKGYAEMPLISYGRAGAKSLSGGPVRMGPGAETRPHHHGEVETIMIVLEGQVRLRWGDALEYASDGQRGDHIFVPPYVPHQEINLSKHDPLTYVCIRSGQDDVHIEVLLRPSEKVEIVNWDDPNHPAIQAGIMRGAFFDR